MNRLNKVKKTVLWIFLGALVFVLGIHSYSPNDYNVPGNLIGEWHSSDPAYAERSLEIDPVSINFGTGNGTVSTGFIKNVKASEDGGRTLYTIRYSVDDTDATVSFFYESGKPDTIRFKNQREVVWTRD
jgi:hypothetical protein